jgi:hypothetical protein
VDVGVVQKNPFEIDHKKTISALKTFYDNLQENKEKIKKDLINWKTNMILFDNCAIAPLIAKELKIPSFGITNFSWDDIYESYSKIDKAYSLYSQINKLQYSRTTLLFAQPFSLPMPGFATGIYNLTKSQREKLDGMERNPKRLDRRY